MIADVPPRWVAVQVAPSYTTGQIAGVQMTAQGVLAFGAPPCGTKEAKKASACIEWKLVPCPAQGTNYALPIGCDVVGPIPQMRTESKRHD